MRAWLSALGTDDYRAIARARVRFNAAPLLISLVVAGVVWGWQHQQGIAVAKPVAAQVVKAIVDGEIYLSVAPPKYTGVAAFETAARDIQVPEFSVVHWCVRHPAGRRAGG